MRRLMVIFSGMMIAATAHVRALDWNTFSINQNPVPANAIVSFSVGYPKGWKVFQDSNWRDDIYFDRPVGPSGENICMILRPLSNEISRELTMFTIFYGHDKPAKEAAESFARNMKDYTLSSITTAAGDSGWLLESKLDFQIPKPIGAPPSLGEFNRNRSTVQLIRAASKLTVEKVIDQQYFFHSGSKGSIRIDIMTPAGDSALRSDLDKLVLQTLRFAGTGH